MLWAKFIHYKGIKKIWPKRSFMESTPVDGIEGLVIHDLIVVITGLQNKQKLYPTSRPWSQSYDF
jgi:hypothetical protein